MFKIQELNKPETAIWLNTLETLLSTADSADIRLKKGFMQDSVTSVKITLEGEKLFLTDLTFNQAILVNDNSLAKGARIELHHNDVLAIGDDKFAIFNPSIALKRLTNSELAFSSWELESTDNWLQGQRFEIKGRAVLGRGKDCDITIPGSHLSRRHAEFFVAGDKLLLKDLDSSNGSFVNGQAVTEAKLRHGDQIRLDQLSFKVIAPEQDALGLNTASDANGAATEPSILGGENQTVFSTPKPASEKQWVTKPTSVGNQVTDADLLLEKHQRNQKLTVFVFGTAILISVLGTILWSL